MYLKMFTINYYLAFFKITLVQRDCMTNVTRFMYTFTYEFY